MIGLRAWMRITLRRGAFGGKIEARQHGAALLQKLGEALLHQFNIKCVDRFIIVLAVGEARRFSLALEKIVERKAEGIRAGRLDAPNEHIRGGGLAGAGRSRQHDHLASAAGGHDKIGDLVDPLGILLLHLADQLGGRVEHRVVDVPQALGVVNVVINKIDHRIP